MKLKMRLYYKVLKLGFSFVVALAVAATAFPVIDLVLSSSEAQKKRERLKMYWFKWLATIFCVRITKVGEPSDLSGLMVSNHISWLDILVLNSLFPTNFVAKSDMSTWPVIGYLAKKGSTIFIRRGDKQQIKATAEVIVWQLKRNSMVIVFPEGTTTNGDEVLPFHASLFQSALLAKSPIQAVCIKYLAEAKEQAPFIGDDEFVSHLMKMLTLEHIDVRVEFISSINTSGKTRLAISNEAREMIMDCLYQENQNTNTQVPMLKSTL